MPTLASRVTALEAADKTLAARVTALEADVTVLAADVAVLKVPTPEPEPDPIPAPEPDEYATYIQRWVTVLPGQDLAAAFAASPSTAIIGLGRGTHLRDLFQMKSGQTVVGELDPLTADTFFPLGRPITKLSPTHLGAVCKVPAGSKAFALEITGMQDPDVAIDFGNNTVGAHIFSHHNLNGGIGFGGPCHLSYWETSDNGRIGIKGRTNDEFDYQQGGLIRFGYSARNNAALLHPPNWEAGGSKFLNHHDLVLEDLLFEDNGGPGLWIDHGGLRNIARRIVARRNLGNLFWEITSGGLLEDCVSVDGTAINGVTAGAIYISNSSDVTIRHCTGSGIGSHAAIAAKDDLSRIGHPHPTGLIVEDSEFERLLPGGFNAAVWGFEGGISSGEIKATFRRNTYRVASAFTDGAWGWPNRQGWAQWQALGYDLDSTLIVQ